MARQVERGANLAKERRQVFQFIGSTPEGSFKFKRKALEVGPTASRNNHAIGVKRTGQPAHKYGFGHQRRDLDPDVKDRPLELCRPHLLQDLLETLLSE